MELQPLKVTYQNRIWEIFEINFTHQEVCIQRGTKKLGGIPFSQVRLTKGQMRLLAAQQIKQL